MQEIKINKILIIATIFLIVLRIISLFIIPYFPHLEKYKISNIPEAGSYKLGNYFSAIKEGDEVTYFNMSKMIYNFDFKEDATMLGYPLMITPFIFFFGEKFEKVFFPLVFFNAVILFSLSLILIVCSSFLVFKKKLLALFSGFLFLISPFIFYIFRNYGPKFETGAWNDINFFHINWLAPMTDQPAAFFSLLILFLLIFFADKKNDTIFYSIIGFLAGFSTLIRITNIVFIIAVLILIFLFERIQKFKKLFFCLISSLIAFSPQFLYNIIFFKSPFSFGYQREYSTAWAVAGSAKGAMWSIGNFFHLFSRAMDYSLLIIPAFFILFILVILGIVYIAKINKRQAFIMTLWFFLPVLIYMFFQTGQTAMRYYMPAIPPFIILAVAALILITEKIKKFLNFC